MGRPLFRWTQTIYIVLLSLSLSLYWTMLKDSYLAAGSYLPGNRLPLGVTVRVIPGRVQSTCLRYSNVQFPTQSSSNCFARNSIIMIRIVWYICQSKFICIISKTFSGKTTRENIFQFLYKNPLPH